MVDDAPLEISTFYIVKSMRPKLFLLIELTENIGKAKKGKRGSKIFKNLTPDLGVGRY